MLSGLRQHEDLLHALIALALPATVSTYCFFAISLTQLSIMGHLGVDELAAVAYSRVSMDFLVLITMKGFNAGMNALCSQAFGAANSQLLNKYCMITSTMLTLLCVPMAVVWWNLGDLLLLVGVTPQIAAHARLFCRVWIAGMWPLTLFEMLAIYYQAQQLAVPTAVANCLTVLVTWVLASSLTHGYLGLPALGFIGCPLGTTLAMWLRFVGFVFYMTGYKKHGPDITTWTSRSLMDSREAFMTLVSVGFPLAMGNFLENSQFQVMTLISAKIGDVQLGTHNSMMELVFFLSSPIYGLLDSAVSLVGKHLGAGQAETARAMALTAGICIGLVAVVTASTMLLLSSSIGRFFTDDSAVIHSFQQIDLLAAAGYVFFSFFAYAAVVFESQGRSTPIFISFLSGSWGVGVPLGYFLGLGQGRKWLLGVWIGLVSGYLTTSAIGFSLAYFTTDWKEQAARAVERSREKGNAAELKAALL